MNLDRTIDSLHKKLYDIENNSIKDDILEAKRQLAVILDKQEKNIHGYNPESWNKNVEWLEETYPHIPKALGFKKLDLSKYDHSLSLRENLRRQGAKK
jgi:hypothetical protein